MQERDTEKPTEYLGAGSNIYLKQVQNFCELLKSGKTDYYYLDRAVQVQQIVDEIYKNN